MLVLHTLTLLALAVAAPADEARADDAPSPERALEAPQLEEPAITAPKSDPPRDDASAETTTPEPIGQPMTADDFNELRGTFNVIRQRHEEAKPRPPKLAGHWRASFSVGYQELLADNVDWFGGGDEAETQLAVERNLGDLLEVVPGLGVRLGLGFSSRTREALQLNLTEVEVGASYQFPHEGIAGVIYPYARVDLVLGWANYEAATTLRGDTFVPGFAANVGLRAALPRIGHSFRFYGFAEGGFQYRASFMARVGSSEFADEDDIPSRNVPLGELELSGYALRFGLGFEL